MSFFRNRTFDSAPLVLHGQGPDFVHPFWSEIVAAFFAEPRQHLGAIDDLTIITWNNGARADLGLLERSLDHLGVPYRVLGAEIASWRSSRDKPRLTAEALAEITTPFVLGVDSRDAILVGDPRDLPRRLPAGCDLLFNAERVHFPFVPALKVFEDQCTAAKASPYRYLNGGAWLGRLAFCRRFFAEACDTPPLAEHPSSEQGILKQLLPRHHPRVQLDTRCRLFQTLGFVFQRDFELMPAETYRPPLDLRSLREAAASEAPGALRERLLRTFPELRSIEPLHGSGQCFVVRDADGKTHKLRVCASDREASLLAARAWRLRGVMPPPLRREGRCLFLPLLSGRKLVRWEPAPIMHQLGVLHARAHRQVCHGRSEDLDDFFADLVARAICAGAVDATRGRRLRATYQACRGDHDLAFALDLRDSSQRNFLVRGEEVVFVDEGGVGKLLGVGLERMMKRLSRLPSMKRSRIDLAPLRAGYESLGQPFPAPGYLQLVGLVDLCQRLYRHHLAGESTRRGLEDLDRLLDRRAGYGDARRQPATSS